MKSFSNIIQDLSVVDLPLQGAQYTWSRGGDSMQISRIDRFLMSSEWNENFKVVKQFALPRVISDHRPLLLECGDWEAKPSYFKFENMWLQAEGFMDKVEEWWLNYTIKGSPDFILTQKLKKLKKVITDWNKAAFGHLETRKSQILEDLMLLETIAETRLMSQAEEEKSVTLKHELQKLANCRRSVLEAKIQVFMAQRRRQEY